MDRDFKKILLIDDKSEGSYRGEVFYNNLCDRKKTIIDYYSQLNGIIEIVDEWVVKILFEVNKYELVLLHASFDSHHLNESQLSSLKELLKNKLITFSGDNEINMENNKTSRQRLFNVLAHCIEAYLSTGMFPKNVLYRSLNPYYPLFDKMVEIIEDFGKEVFISSKEFELFLGILGYDIEKVKENYRNKNENDLIEKINEWRINQKI